MLLQPSEHVCISERHATHYLAAGPEDGPLLIFVHGWPELAISWRHQLPALAALGFRCIAPDMRGYGRSSVPDRHEDYAIREVVADMLELLAATGRDSAVWIGHDWGSGVVWSLASHHPERCTAVASLCVPYGSLERGIQGRADLVDRRVYPADEFPVGQWDYMLFYQENFERARAGFEANTVNTCKALFRAGNPAGRGKPSLTAMVRANNGWFGEANVAPDLPLDTRVLNETDLAAYASALQRNGFFGPDSYYMNDQRNMDYAAEAVNGGKLAMPVLFIAASHDFTCETIDSDLAKPMTGLCSDLSRAQVDSGHWMAQEKPMEVNGVLANWLATRLPDYWPKSRPAG